MKTEYLSLNHCRSLLWLKVMFATCGLLLFQKHVSGAERFFNLSGDPQNPESWALWEDPASWFGGVGPDSSDIIRIYKNSGTSPVHARLTSDFLAHSVTLNYNSGLYLADGAHLRMNGPAGGDGRLHVFGGSRLVVSSGAALSWSDAGNPNTELKIDGAVVENFGSFQAPRVNISPTGVFLQKAGQFAVANSSPGVALAGQFIQTGGIMQEVEFFRMDGGTFHIKGGEVNVKTLQFNSGLVHVDGSGAEKINVQTFRQDGGTKSSFIFTLDHTDSHITHVNIVLADKQFHSLRLTSSLEMRLRGGILLADQREFTLFERGPGISDSAGWMQGPGMLWEDTTASSEGRNYIRASLSEEARVGELSSENPELVFSATDQGYVDLRDIDFSEPIVLSLDLTQESILLQAALTANGITWMAGDGDYELRLILDPGQAGGSYFAWDFHDIDAALQLQGIALGVIPEPNTWALLGATAAGAIVFLRRRKGE